MPSERQARDALVLEHAGWARKLALSTIRQRGLFLAPEDAIAVANLALVVAANRYKLPSAASFPTFAHRHVVGAILDHCYDMNGADRVVLDAGRRRFWPRPISLDDLSREPTDPAPSPFVSALRRKMFELVVALPSRESYVILEHYLNDRPLADIGRELGVTESRVCQIVKEGIEHLQEVRRRPRK